MKVIKTGNKTWENRHEIFVENINNMYVLGNEDALDALDGYNDSTKGIQDLIGKAIASNVPLRALGAGWSWTKIATVQDGIMLDTKPLNTVFDITEGSVSPAYTGKVENLLLAQSGTGIWELGKYLRTKNQSLKASGASNGQTIAGAMGTGAHGSAFDVGAVQDYVVGIHLITGPNKHIWLERASAPVVSAQFVERLGTKLVQDDDLFNAVLISFGSFGIIHGVMIETDDLFLLEAYMQRIPYDDSLKSIMNTLDFSNAHLPAGSERPYHFAVLLNPYDMDKGVYVTTMYKRPFVTDYKPPVDNPSGIGPGDDAPCFIGTITDAIPAIVPTLVTKVLGASLTLYEKQFGTLNEIFSNTTLRGKLLSAAVGFPVEFTTRVADLMLSVNKTIGPFAGLFSFRFVKQTKATLGFTRFAHTCIMELDAAFSDKTYTFYTKVWKKLEDEQIPFTFHWGKVNELSPERLSNMYGPAVDSWIAARNKLLDPDSMRVFTNPILEQWGLNKVIV
jgi:hypothetical protein